MKNERRKTVEWWTKDGGMDVFWVVDSVQFVKLLCRL